MPARRIKSLYPQNGYGHREHRSRRSIKGFNHPLKRSSRLRKLGIARKREAYHLKFIERMLKNI